MKLALSDAFSLSRVFGDARFLGRLNPAQWQGRTTRIVLALLVAALIGVGTLINLRLYLSRVELQRQIDADERALSTLPSVRRSIEDARAQRIRLVTERDRLFATVPDLTNIPFIIQQLEQLGRLSGGRVVNLDYSPTAWNENRSDVLVHLRFQGSFHSILTFLTGLRDSFPTARIDQLALDTPVGRDAAHLALDTTLRISVLETRPDAFPDWDQTQLFARDVVPLPSPFEPPLGVWGVGRSLGLELPEWQLRGIVDHRGTRMALLQIDSRSRVVRVGDVVDGVVIVAIGDTYIRAQMGGRESVLRLGGER